MKSQKKKINDREIYNINYKLREIDQRVLYEIPKFIIIPTDKILKMKIPTIIILKNVHKLDTQQEFQ